MAWSTPATVVTGTVITASWGNTSVRDLFSETAPAKVTTQGDTIYATGANAIARLAKGTGLQIYRMNSGATAPEWVTLTAALVAAGTFPAGAFVFASQSSVEINYTHADATSAMVQRWKHSSSYDLTLTGNRPSGGHIQYDFSQQVNGVTYNVLTFKAGNVGIGTKDPSVLLHVIGGRSSFNAASEQYAVGARYVSTAGAVYFGATNSATPDLVFSNNAGTTILQSGNDGRLTVAGVVSNVVTLANNATAALCQTNSPTGVVSIAVSGTTAAAVYVVSNTSTAELSDPSASFTPTAGGGTYNVYWSAGNSRYEIENRSGGSKTFYITLLGAP